MKSTGEHRRGRSMGSVPPAATRAGEKDEDLALFHEMKRREKHNFLHPSPDDLDATLSSKFGGMGAPTKKPGTDLLTSESDKNDYDWLLTPPGTPLFPSLDQEAAALAVLSPALSNGSYSSASSATKSLKSSTYSPAESVSKGSRGNPSPRRQGSVGSTTPNGISRSRSSPGTAATLARPSTPTLDTGPRPSTPTSKSSTPSVRASTPNLKLTISHSSKSYSTASTPTGTRPSTPTPRSSTPPVRPSTPGGRSSTPTSKPSTPTMRRSLSGGRSSLTSPSTTTTRGGPSPKRTTSSSSRGSSPSAKRVTSVITSIAGMSSEAPPNLRTTMPERPTSAGKSNISNGSRAGSDSGYNGNVVEESVQSRRRPRSPSVARSFSSSSSQDQRTSSQTSRGSVISSYDDGLEVNRPSSMGSTRNSAAPKWHAAGHEELLGGKNNAFAKRVAKSTAASKDTSGFGAAPARKSSDPVKRQVDAYQNSPTTAYRHLHSSSPVSPFYTIRSNSLLPRTGSAMNSSVTTSSNASSEHGTTIAADTEGSERDEDDLLSWDSYGRRASTSPRLQQADILVLDKDDEKTGLWQDALYERANSNEPSSSHSQGSQSTLDAEVTGFFETDGIASLEMLEQLGLMGESYKLKKSSTFGGRSSEKRTSTEDSKVSTLGADEVGHSPKFSPHKIFPEGQGTPTRHGVQLERQESSDRVRKSRDFETELLKRNGEKSMGLPEPKVPNSEIRAACLFVRDFKVGLSPPRTQHAPVFVKDSSPGSKKYGIDEMEMKLRNELSHDWDNSIEAVDRPTMDAKGDIERKLSDSPILVPSPKKNATALELAPPLSLEDPFIPDSAVDNGKINDSLVMAELPKDVGIEVTRNADLQAEDVEHPISINRTPSSAVTDSSCLQDGVMDESETESTPPGDVGVDSRIPLEYNQSAMADSQFVDSTFALKKEANWDTTHFIDQTLENQSGLSDDGVYAMDEDSPEHVVENATVVHGSGEESELLKSTEGGHVHMKEEQDGSPMHVDETCISVLEKQNEDVCEGMVEMEVSQAKCQPEVDGLHRKRPREADDPQDVADKVFSRIHSSEADNEQNLADEELDRMWSAEENGQQDNVNNGIEVGEHGHDVAGEVLPHVISREANGLQDSGREIEQGRYVHSNGNHDPLDQECVALANHDTDGVLQTSANEPQSPQKLVGHFDEQSPVDVMESSAEISNVYSDDRDCDEESKLHENYKIPGADEAQKDVLGSGDKWEGTQNPEVEQLEITTTQATVEGAGTCSSDHQVQEESQSQSLEYFDADSVAILDDTGEEVSSGLSIQEELQSQKKCNADSVKEVDFLDKPSPEEEDLLQKNLSPSTQFVQEIHPKSIKLVEKQLPDVTDWCIENQQQPNGRTDTNEIDSNCKPKSAPQFFESPAEVLDLPLKSEETSEAQPPKPEFRSASTLCAALEEQIAGLIQKIDSAIEESSKPFNASPQESLLVKDKRTTLSSELARELGQDDCTGSVRPSQEEDLLDMLWAEDDESSCSEGSRDQDFLNSKDDSQREMNGVRSSRLSDRGLPATLVGQSNDGYDSLVRSSRSDLGVEKHILEESSRKSTVALVDQQEDVDMHTRDLVGSPRLRNTNMTRQNVGVHDSVPEDNHFHVDFQSKIERSGTDTIPSGKVVGDGGQLKTYEDLHTVSCVEEYFKEYSSDSLTEYSGDDGDDAKTDEELLSLCRYDQRDGDSDSLRKAFVDEEFSNPDMGPAADEDSFAEERWDKDSTKLEESPQESRRSSEAALISIPHKDVGLTILSPSEQDKITTIMSNGNGETVEVMDLAIQEVAHNRDRDESPILLTLARSDVSSRGNEAPNEVWLHRKSKEPEEPSSRSVMAVGHLAGEVPENELQEEHGVSQEALSSPSQSLMTQLLDLRTQEEASKMDEDEACSIHFNNDSHLSDSGIELTQESEKVQNCHEQLLPQPQHDVYWGHTSLDTRAKKEGSSGTDFDDYRKVTFSNLCSASNINVIESTHLPDIDSAIHGDQNMRSDEDADVREDLFNFVEESQQLSPQRIFVSPSKSLQIGNEDGMQSKRAQAVQEDRMLLQGHPEIAPVALSNGESEEAQIVKWKSKEMQKDSWKGQRISLIAGTKIPRPDTESFRMEDNESGSELGEQLSSVPSDVRPTTNVRENGSLEAHVSDQVKEQNHASNDLKPPTEQNRVNGDWSTEGSAAGLQEVTRLSVWSELPAVDFCSVRRPVVGKEEMKVKKDDYSSGVNGNEELGTKDENSSELGNEDLGTRDENASELGNEDLGTRDESASELGNEDLGTRDENASDLGNQSLRRLPINKAKSVRTISLSPISHTDSPSEQPGSPDGAMQEGRTPQKSGAYANITVISPEKLQWDHSSSDESATKTRSSPPSLSRSMTLAEATDTILYCSSLMHTIVYKAAAYAIEKEELAALATPTSNGEVLHSPGPCEADNREENDSGVQEAGKWKAQGVSTGPPSARRSLSYMGHQTVPSTPTDTSLQIPVDQVIESTKSPEKAENAAHTAIQADEKDEKDEVMPVKVTKSKCGCSIM